MTKAEFIALQQVAKRSQNVGASISLVVLLVALLGSMAVCDWYNHHQYAGWNPLVLGYALFMVLCVITLSVLMVRSIRIARKHGQRCSTCGAFFHGFAGQIAVASGHCGNCGAAAYES